MHYEVISTDDHLQESSTVWTDRMSKSKWGDKVPQIREVEGGNERWHIWDIPMQRSLGTVQGAVAGEFPDGLGPDRWEDMPKKTYVPAERLKAMEEDGVDVHTFFSNIAGVAGQTFSNPIYEDVDFRMECIRAYNDWQIEEWADPYPGRFITIALVPLWDAQLAAAEVRRMHKRGVKAISFSFPQQFNYPHISDPFWDPFWQAAQDAGLSVNLHIGSGGSIGIINESWGGRGRMVQVADGSTKGLASNIQVMSTLLYSGIFDRFPTLKFVSSESGLGWAPYLLETADHQWESQRLYKHGMPTKPSELFHRQCYINFWYEETGIALRHAIGIDNIMWESDFPHPTGSYPNSRAYIERTLAGVPEDERRKMLVENAIRVFNLDGQA